MNNDLMFSSKNNEWETPQNLFDTLDKEFCFTLDPCATPQTAKCKKFYTKEDNGLSKDWAYQTVFCNPPYGREIKHWVKKCWGESLNALVVMLIPARTDTQYFHKYIYNQNDITIRFIKGRLKFGNSKNSAPFPSMIVIFR